MQRTSTLRFGDVRSEMSWKKTKKRQKLFLPTELLDLLRWHVDHQIPEGIKAKTDLLSPSETGGFRAASALKVPFEKTVEAIGLGKRVTPRAMRRTYQDLARAAEMRDLVTRAISGHATEQMHLVSRLGRRHTHLPEGDGTQSDASQFQFTSWHQARRLRRPVAERRR